MLTYHKITEEEKYLIAEWKYEGDYAIYNMESYEEQKKSGCGFANPKNNFYSFYDEEILIGFINLQEQEKEVFFVLQCIISHRLGHGDDSGAGGGGCQ